jgi:error-prone DNA polymerase
MPDLPYKKYKPLIKKPQGVISAQGPSYAELFATSNFSFLCGASHPDEYIMQAQELGLAALGIADCNSLAGIVRAHTAAKELGFNYRVGCRVELLSHFNTEENPPLRCSFLYYPCSRKAYGSLCRTLSIGNGRTTKGNCLLGLADLKQLLLTDSALVLIPPSTLARTPEEPQRNHSFFLELCQTLKDHNPHMLGLALARGYSHNQGANETIIREVAATFTIPLIATNAPLFHIQERKRICDILTCFKYKTTIQEAGFLLQANAQAYLKSPKEMAYLFRDLPQAMTQTLVIAEAAGAFSLNELRYTYPDAACIEGLSPLEYLSKLTWQGAEQRFHHAVPEKIARLITEELQLIHELGYEKYFLTCYDIVCFARSKNILCQGRGAAANSAVCYCLGITSVDPSKIDLLFSRFISRARSEPPDIDIDFEHERREEVIQYIYEKYGREYAALTAEVVSYRQRSAARETAKAMGLSLEIADRFAKSIHRWTGCQIPADDLRAIGLDPAQPIVQQTLEITHELLSFPRHLSQHVGGFIISDSPLCELVPTLPAGMKDRTIIEWDKDDIEALGMLKIDVLALGMLTCIRKALDYINEQRSQQGRSALALHSIPAEDPAVYDMLCAADTVGVFQIESRAQMSMLPRLRPRCFYDLVIEVAIVRPGPIQGNMVHPFLKRRSGLEQARYPDERVREILGKTLGVPIFQEQAMRLAIVLANFSPDEAEALRRAMAAWKKDKGRLASFYERILAGMLANGYDRAFAETCFSQMKGFSEYGFPESHAASFALLVYASAWIKHHHPDAFLAALLNSQPMGFYAPAQLIADARAHNVEVLPVDAQKSSWDCLVLGNAVRLGLRLIYGIARNQSELLLKFSNLRWQTIEELWALANGSGLRKQTLILLAKADAFSSLGSSREVLWRIAALPKEILPLDTIFLQGSAESTPALPKMSAQQNMFQDYQTTGLSLRGHPIGFIRQELQTRKVETAANLRISSKTKTRSQVAVAGLVLVRQRPGTARGVVFITLEDETGMTNLIIRPSVFEQYQKLIIMHKSLLARGILERAGAVVYVNVQTIESLDDLVFKAQKIPVAVKSYSY